MAYAIPQIYRAGFELLAGLSDDDFESLRHGFGSAAPTANLPVFGQRAADASGLAVDTATAIAASVFSLAALRSQNRTTAQGLVDDLLFGSLKLAEGAEQRLRPRIVTLLDVQAVRLSARAIDLVAADQRLLVSARIVTDIRPVFPDPDVAGDTDAIEPLGSLTIHLLRLEYLEAGQTKTFLVSLDAADLGLLDEAVHRAVKKAESAARMSDAAGLAQLSPF